MRLTPDQPFFFPLALRLCSPLTRLSRALMTTRGEEVRVCHVGLCATHLHCCSSSPGLTFRAFLSSQLDEKRPPSRAGAVVARHRIGAATDIEAERRRNARCCLDSSHNWLMHPRSVQPPACCRCCVSNDGLTQLLNYLRLLLQGLPASYLLPSFCFHGLLFFIFFIKKKKCAPKFPQCENDNAAWCHQSDRQL